MACGFIYFCDQLRLGFKIRFLCAKYCNKLFKFVGVFELKWYDS